MSTCTVHGFHINDECPKCESRQSDVYILSERECKDLALWLDGEGRAMVMIDNEGFKIKFGEMPLAVWSRGLGTKL